MTLDTERGVRSWYEYLTRWVLIEGDRLVLTACVVVAFFLYMWAFTSHGVLSVGPRSSIQSILGSGVVAGLFSLISVTLLINQLISSRVFSSLDTLQEKLEGGVELRDTVSAIADHPSPPVHTADFIAFTGETIQTELEALQGNHKYRDETTEETIESYISDMREYTDILQQVSADMPAEEVISTLASPEFAHQLNATDYIQSTEYKNLSRDERKSLDSIAELLGVISVARQYFKTIALHQELAQLSRQFVFVGFPAVVVALLVPLVYRTNPPEVLTSYPLAPLVSASFAIILAPLVLLLAYMLRISTIFRYTVSVAPFVPPAERSWTDTSDQT